MTGNEAMLVPGRDERLREGLVVPHAGPRETVAGQRRRESRREEAATQVLFVEILQELLDPAFALFSALENRPRSAWSGLRQKQRGVRAGLPDLMILEPATGPSAGKNNSEPAAFYALGFPRRAIGQLFTSPPVADGHAQGAKHSVAS